MIFNKPEFICIGSQKAGTTWLYKTLQKHSDFLLPPYKEVSFFDYADSNLPNSLKLKIKHDHWLIKRWMHLYDKYVVSKDDISNYDWYLKYLSINRSFKPEDLSNYSKLFSNEFVTGDISPTYLYLSKNSIKIILKHFPNTKIILMLRDPIEREWSMMKMRFRNRNKKKLNKVSNKEINEFIRKKYRISNLYAGLKNWLEIYPKDKMLILFYDDLKTDEYKTYEEVMNFLNIKSKSKLNTEQVAEKVNSSSIDDTEIFNHHKSLLIRKFTNQLINLNSLLDHKHTNRWCDKYNIPIL